MAWNFNQHSNRDFPRFYRFVITYRAIEQTDNCSVQERIAKIESLLSEIAERRASSLLENVFNQYHKYDISFERIPFQSESLVLS